MLDLLPTSLTAEQLWSLVGRIEHERLDFGRSTSKDLQKTFAAMAMTDGGRILLGIEDDLRISGCRLDQRTFDAVLKVAGDLGLELRQQEVLVDGVPVVEIIVPAVIDRIITTTDGRLLRRNGSESRPLTGSALGQFARDRLGPAPEDVSLPVGLDVLDLRALNQALVASGRPTVRRAGAWRALADLGVGQPGAKQLTRGAVLLFGQPQACADAGLRLQLVHRAGPFPSDGMSLDRREMTGPLAVAAAAASAWIAQRLSAGEVVIGDTRGTVQKIPKEAIREALLNALAHQDLNLDGATIDVVVWDDALQIRSPGGLAGHVTASNIRHEHFSRNPRVMRVLKVLDLVEEFGEGMDRMWAAMESRLLPEPNVEAAGASVTVTLRSESPIPLEDQVWLSLLAPLDLLPAERAALALARRHGSLARKDLAMLQPDADAGPTLSGLVVKGMLVRSGERGGARYHLAPEVIARAGAGGVQDRQRQRQRVADFVRVQASVSSQQVADHLGTDTGSARSLLQDLVRAGRLTRTGRTRGTRYHAIPRG